MIILFLIEMFAAFKSVSSPENTLRWIELYQIILGIFFKPFNFILEPSQLAIF